ncbi:MAG: beta-ketoacyl synthase N-terminal-like domain-containing protein [Planctomycetaceae bacterium]
MPTFFFRFGRELACLLKANLQQPLAIVGMACRLPGADNIEEYWELLREGRSGLTQFPPERVNPDLYYDPKPGEFCKTYTQAGGYIAPVKSTPKFCRC